MRLASILLLVAVVRHYGYDLFPVEHRGLASKALGGVALLCMIWLAYSLRPSALALPVALWWSYEELQVVLCSLAYMRWPWPVEPGQSICSAAVGIDLGAASIVLVAFLARAQAVRSDR